MRQHTPDTPSAPVNLRKRAGTAPPSPRTRASHLDVHFSSATDEWATPQDLYDQLHAEFHFTVDVCASASNAKCARFFTKELDGLAQRWTGTCWMNPPYGRTIGDWVGKAHESALQGATVVALLPARTDTAWWHDHVVHASEVRFLRRRLRFGDAKAGAPFPSAIVVFRPPEASAGRWARAIFTRDTGRTTCERTTPDAQSMRWNRR